VDLKRRLRSAEVLTDSDDFFLGQGTRAQRVERFPGPELIGSSIAPALERAFDESTAAGLRAATLIALAKLHPTWTPEEGTPTARPLAALADRNRSVSQAAILALGLIAEPDAARVLCDLAADEESVAQLLGRTSVPEVFRVHAALAAGLVGARTEREEVRRYVVHRLSLLLDERVAAPDLHIACLTSMGLSPLAERAALEASSGRGRSLRPSSSRAGQVRFLLDVLEDRERQEFVRAHVPKALGLLAEDASEDLRDEVKHGLLDMLGARKREKRLVRYGVVEALGRLGDSDGDPVDVELRRALRGVVRDGDAFGRNLALLSVAYVATRPGSGDGEPLGGLRSEESFLLKQFAQGQSRMRPWAALALGLHGYHALEEDVAHYDSTNVALRRTLERTRSSADANALCLALGLRRDSEAVPALLERLESTRDDVQRGRVAMALGLSGAREAIEPLQEIVRESRYHPSLLRDAAVALALLGSRGMTSDLLAILEESRSNAVRVGVVSAIGFVGDVRTVEPLLEILGDPQKSTSLRTSAAQALGIACEDESLPWNAGFINRMNYTAMTATLMSGDGTGFLDRP